MSQHNPPPHRPARGVTFSEQIKMQSINKSARCYSLDVVKCFAAFLVVFIHSWDRTSVFHLYFLSFTKLGVPLFLLVSGYYLTDFSIDKFTKKIKHLLLLTLIASVVYMLWTLLYNVLVHNVDAMIEEWTAFDTWYNFLVFNFANFFAGHLWYMFALLYALVVLFCCKNHIKYLQVLIVPLLIISYGLSYYGVVYWYRNWLLLALPYLLLGIYIRRKQWSLLSNKFLVYILMLCSAILVWETYYYIAHGMVVTRDTYLMTPVMAIFIFILAINNASFGKNSLVALIGREYSPWIYLYHLLWLTPLRVLCGRISCLRPWMPILMFVLIICSIYLFKKTKNVLLKV